MSWLAGAALRTRPRWRRLWALLLAGLLAAGAVLAAPARHALLVGVSQLPDQPPADWLLAPANDVRLMRQALLAQGWAPAGIEILADGVAAAAAPRLEAIRAAFSRLATTAAPGDFVLLYFSGHGTRLRDPGKSYHEPDRLSEVFLAPDGGLHDAEIGRWVQALLARGAFVWAVFDTCSAASMTRGGAPAALAAPAAGDDDPVRFRGLGAGELAPAQRAAALARGAGPAPQAGGPWVPPARYVAFFASESHQATPELRLPRHQAGAAMHGMLTWALADALQGDPPTWRALFEQVLARYPAVIDELEQRFPTRELPSPVAEGALDAPLWQNGAVASTHPAWPARRDGAELVVAAGLLDGVLPGQALRISALDGDGRPHGAEQVALAPGAGSTRLALPAALVALPPGVDWQVAPLAAPAALALRVRAEDAAARQALDGINLDYPASLRLVDAGPADVRVLARGAHFVLESADPAASLRIDGADALRRQLAGLATRRWLERLAGLARAPTLAPLEGFEAALRADTGPGARAEPLAAGLQSPPADAALEVRNASGTSVDLMIVGVAGDGGVWPVFPAALGETNRFERGDASAPARQRFALPAALTEPGGVLLVLATPARPRSPPRLFGLAPAARDSPADVLLRSVADVASDRAYAVLAHW